MIKHINKRKELTEYFDKILTGNAGFMVRMSSDDHYAHIILDNEPGAELVVPLTDLVFYAGFSSKKYFEHIRLKKS